MSAVRRAVTEGRVVALNDLHGELEAVHASMGDGHAELEAVLTGHRQTARLALSPAHPALDRVVRALRFRTGAELEIIPETAGDCRLVDPACSDDAAPNRVDLRRPVPARSRVGPAPVLVLSTAGDPGMVRQCLGEQLRTIKRYEHRDVRILVVDDAPAALSDSLDGELAALADESGVPITRFNEWEADGDAGPKARFRSALAEEMDAHDDSQKHVARVFAASAFGSANIAFIFLSGLPLVWIEQDAAPYALHVPDPSAPFPGPEGSRIEWSAEFSEVPAGAVREPVDILHIVDLMLYGPPGADSYERLEPTWENAGFERVGGRLRQPLEPRLCFFHIAGHGDYRARFLHNVLVLNDPPPAARRVLFSGGLDRFSVFTHPPKPVIVENGVHTFGTAVGFHHDLPLPVPMMMATRQRLFDFTVTAVLRAAGACPAGVAGTGLTHERQAATTSGRGSLPRYVDSELLLWPLFNALTDALAVLPARAGRPAEVWFGEAAAAIERFADDWHVPAAATRHIWLERQADLEAVRDLRLPADTREYLRLVCERLPDDWLTLHRAVNEKIRGELRAFSGQLALYAMLSPEVIGRARRTVSAIWDAVR